MQPGLIIVSNRLPVSVKKVDGKLEFYPSIGGLATGLASYAKDSRNKWIGWPGIANDELNEAERQQIAEELAEKNCYPVFLNQKQLDEYYNGYSNSVLWPMFHGNPIGEAAAEDTTSLWRAYQKVNQAFAEVVLALSNADSVIWVHDYQLMTLPAELRRERPDGRIGFFLHIPFPPADSFGDIKEADAILAGVLGADLIGLQTEADVTNFLDSVQTQDTGVTAHHKVILANRVVRVTDFPISIDYAKYEKARRSRAVMREYAKLRVAYVGMKMILTVDRLDPSKALVQRVEAYRTLLRQNPRLRGKVVMVMLVVPSRTDIAEYKQLKEDLERAVDETNKEFGALPWLPIEYRFEALPFEQVTALYRRADVAFIAPLRDGMNLVAKEYLASKPGKNGALVLSRTAGAAQELKDAIMVDPQRPTTLVKGLSRALNIKPKELKRRVGKMQDQLSTHTVQAWAGKFVRSLNRDIDPMGVTHGLSLTAVRETSMCAAYKKAKSRLLLLDYDGVLMEFHRKFEDAEPTARIRDLLLKLAKDKLNTVVAISGRPQDDLEAWFKGLPVALVAEHGAFWRESGGKWHAVKSKALRGWQEQVVPTLERYANKTAGAKVEIKQQSLVWHYRLAKPYDAQKGLVQLKRALKPLARKLELQVQQGNMILEVRPLGIDKGLAAKTWLSEHPQFILALGDDYTDEDTFKAMPGRAYSIKVGRGRTNARYRLRNVPAVLKLLEKLSQT